MKLADYTFKDTAIIFIFLPVANIIGISIDENQYQINVCQNFYYFGRSILI